MRERLERRLGVVAFRVKREEVGERLDPALVAHRPERRHRSTLDGAIGVVERRDHRVADGCVDRIVLRNLKVLQASTVTDAAKVGSSPGGTMPVMLAVTDTQVQKLFATVQNEGWTLELRPVLKAADSPESVETKTTLIMDGLGASQRRVAVGGAR